jgi:hypothetical protein
MGNYQSANKINQLLIQMKDWESFKWAEKNIKSLLQGRIHITNI